MILNIIFKLKFYLKIENWEKIYSHNKSDLKNESPEYFSKTKTIKNSSKNNKHLMLFLTKHIKEVLNFKINTNLKHKKSKDIQRPTTKIPNINFFLQKLPNSGKQINKTKNLK